MYCEWCDNTESTQKIYKHKIEDVFIGNWNTTYLCYDCFGYSLADLKVGMQVKVKPHCINELTDNKKYTIENICINDIYNNDGTIAFKDCNIEYNFKTMVLKPAF